MSAMTRKWIVYFTYFFLITFIIWQAWILLSRQVQISPDTLSASEEKQEAMTVKKSQNDYLALASQYKLSQMRHLIAEENAAIAKANHLAAEAQLQASLAMHRLEQEAHPIFYGDKKSDPKKETKLFFTRQEKGVWIASVKYQGHIEDLALGTVLPDGAKVISIDASGVLLAKAGNEVRLSFPREAKKVPLSVNAEPPFAPKKEAVLEKLKPMPSPVVLKKMQKTSEEEALLQMDEHSFTLDLMSSQDLNKVQAFLKTHHLEEKAKIYRSPSAEGIRYVLLYSVYPTHQAALLALRDLPIDLKRYMPYPKQVKLVQSELRKANF